MPILNWRPAGRGDRPLLDRFSCTEPAHYDSTQGRPVHPKPWELEVQTGIHKLNPAAPGLYLGLDDEGIGAVYLFADFGTEGFKLRAVAVARRYRGQDGAVAKETIREALATIRDQAASQGQPTAYVFGYIHERNLPSQQMCAVEGFTCDDPIPDEEGLQQWSAVVAGTEDSGPE